MRMCGVVGWSPRLGSAGDSPLPRRESSPKRSVADYRTSPKYLLVYWSSLKDLLPPGNRGMRTSTFQMGQVLVWPCFILDTSRDMLPYDLLIHLVGGVCKYSMPSINFIDPGIVSNSLYLLSTILSC